MIAWRHPLLRYNITRWSGHRSRTMAPLATPTPPSTPMVTSPAAAPSDRLVLLALGSTILWVLAWVVIQLSGYVP